MQQIHVAAAPFGWVAQRCPVASNAVPERSGAITDPSALLSAVDDNPFYPATAGTLFAQKPRLFSRFFGGALNGASMSISNRASSG